MFRIARHLTLGVLGGLTLCSTAGAALITIDFDSLPGMVNAPGSAVPLENQLSDQLLPTTGALFGSASDYVAVVAMSPGQTTVSMPNVIGGVTSDGRLSYGTDVTIAFFDPSSATTKATTDFVSIRGDTTPLPVASATMEAFDLFGNSLGSVTANDVATGLVLAISQPGIHSVRISQNSAFGSVDGSIGLDNLEFNSVTSVPLPAALWLFVSGLGVLGVPVTRRRTRLS